MVAELPNEVEHHNPKPLVIGRLAATLQEGARWAAWASLIVVPTALAVADKVAGATIAAASIATALLLLELPNLQSLSLGVLKAEMRKETWRAKVAADQANATVKQLHELAALLSRTMLGGLGGSGRWPGGGQTQIKHVAKDRVVAGLKELGVSPEHLKDALRDFDLWTALDLSNCLVDAIQRSTTTTAETKESVLACIIPLRSGIGPRCESAAQHRACFSGKLEITPEIEAWLLDLEHLEKHGELRRPEVFFETA